MQSGDLKHRIELQATTKAPDGMGGFTVVWTTMNIVAAAIWPISASEQVKNMGVAMTVTHRIRIRYRANLKASWRIKFENRYFNIVSIIDQNMAHEQLDIMVKEAA